MEYTFTEGKGVGDMAMKLDQSRLIGNFVKMRSWNGVLVLLLAIFTAYAMNMLYFHPLSRVPGPKLAAITNWWSYYYELNKIFPEKCVELAEKHRSRVVRVGPNKVVIHEVSQYDKIYRSGSEYAKDPDFYHLFPSASEGGTAVTATDKQVHRERRKQLAAKLSRQNVTSIQDLVNEKLYRILEIFGKAADDDREVNVFAAWRSFTLDVISTFAFGQCMGGLDCANLDHQMLDTMNIAVGAFYHFIRLPLIARITSTKAIIPYLSRISTDMAAMASFKKWARECVDGYLPDTNVRYLFDALFNPPSGTRKLSKDEIQTEAEDLLIAGSDTTATTLTVALVHLASQPDVWEQLNQELRCVIPDPATIPSWTTLETIPLLAACVKESLRMASPLPGYLWRVVPAEGLTTPSGYYLPHGTRVGMSAQVMHNDKEVFHDPDVFKHSRWLDDDNPEISRYLVPFSKGSRQCAGINLAYMELYTALAVTCRRFVVKTPPGAVPEMRILETFVGVLKNDLCPIIFERRKD